MSDIALNALIRKRAELAGELERHEAAARQLKVDLTHLEATILMLGPDTDLAAIKPKRLRPPQEAGKGDMAHIVFATLRVAERPCSTKELAMHVMAERGMDTADKATVRMMMTRVSVTSTNSRRTTIPGTSTISAASRSAGRPTSSRSITTRPIWRAARKTPPTRRRPRASSLSCAPTNTD